MLDNAAGSRAMMAIRTGMDDDDVRTDTDYDTAGGNVAGICWNGQPDGDGEG